MGREPIIDMRPKVRYVAVRKLVEDHFPEQISKTFKIEYAEEPLMRISHETIYKYIYATPRGTLCKLFSQHLTHRRRMRRGRSRSHEKRGRLVDAIPISKRPREVNDRGVSGHCEGDLIIVKHDKSGLGTLVERKTRLVILVPVKDKNAKTVRESFAEVFKGVEPAMMMSMTYDRGLEMAEHKILTKETRVKIYFAAPYSPWQRGRNENTNGLIRQYFPKGTDFSTVTMEEIKHVQNRINNRPRKVLE